MAPNLTTLMGVFCFRLAAVQFTSWFDHVQGYWGERHKKHRLVLMYEDMKRVRLDLTRVVHWGRLRACSAKTQ